MAPITLPPLWTISHKVVHLTRPKTTIRVITTLSWMGPTILSIRWAPKPLCHTFLRLRTLSSEILIILVTVTILVMGAGALVDNGADPNDLC